MYAETVWNCIVEPHIADCWRLTIGACLLLPSSEGHRMQKCRIKLQTKTHLVRGSVNSKTQSPPWVAASFHRSDDRDPNSTAWWLDVGCVEMSPVDDGVSF